MESVSAFNRHAEEYDEWYREEQDSLIFESEVKAIEFLAPKGLGVEVGAGTGRTRVYMHKSSENTRSRTTEHSIKPF